MRWVLVVAVLVAALLGAASAQAEQATQVGRLDAIVGGEAHTAYAYELARAGAPVTTATFVVLDMGGATFANLNAQFHADDSFSHTGAFSLDASFSAPLATCPCSASFADIYYWTTEALNADFYRSLTWDVTLVSAADNGDGSYRVEGTFSALMGYVDDWSVDDGAPDPSRTIQVSGTFVIARALPE